MLLIPQACEISDDSNQIQNVEELRSDLFNRFDNLGKALRDRDDLEITAEVFKIESIRFLLFVEETDSNFKTVSHNYDLGYKSVFKNELNKDDESLSFNAIYIGRLTKKLLEIEDVPSMKNIFDDVFNEVQFSQDLNEEEKNQLIKAIAWYEASILFLENNLDLFLTEEQFKAITDTQYKGCGWWQKWGKCVAGTIGGYYGGALGGCAVGAAVGATAGGVGAVPGCAVGAVVGAIGGALTGAAASCDGCSE